MAKETKDGKAKASKEPQAEIPSEVATENGASGATKARTARVRKQSLERSVSPRSLPF